MCDIRWVSLTGAEDSCDPSKLAALSRVHPEGEWALLYLIEREGQGRNPSQAWRESFLPQMEACGARTALHLCGKAAFDRVLAEGAWPELRRYGRIQANLNARSMAFGKDEAMAIWEILARDAQGLIIQLHEGVRDWALEFLAKHPRDPKIEVLFDESKGRGISPEFWSESLPGVACGYAGGLGPQNVASRMPAIARAAKSQGCWIDMESQIRTDGLIDLAKCEAVLLAAKPWIKAVKAPAP